MAANARDRHSAILAALAAELRAEAAKQRMSLHEISRRSGIPYPTVQKSMSGRRMIDVAELARLCLALDITPAVLFGRVDEWTTHDEDDGDPRAPTMVGA